MPKEESTGLFSKVVKFVRSPGAAWSDADPDAADSQLSKQMLKEMIERKRRNDFVRKREFDMLRKLRRSEVMAGQDPAARPSFFQSSLPSKPDDRASTLKKIDEIEAQMSMQWWKTKHGDREHAGSSTNFPVSGAAALSPQPPRADAVASPASAPMPVARASGPMPIERPAAYPQAAALQPAKPPVADEPGPLIDAEFDFTKELFESPAPAAAAPAPAAAPVPAPPPPAPMPMVDFSPPATASRGSPPAAPKKPDRGSAMRAAMSLMGNGAADAGGPVSVFSASKMVAIDVDEFAHDPELEEAAIRFANGDDAGAEAGLVEVLGPNGQRVDHDETWLTLFDLYRATGQQERFETVAIDFAGRFGRSAPQWVSMPEAVGRMGQAAASLDAVASGPPDWVAPVVLGSQSVPALAASMAKAAQPWRLSWAKLTGIEEAALEPLARLFGQWAGQPVQLRFLAGETLERVLKDRATSGDKSVNPAWWKLLMEVLRVMHRPDEFELVALDYCVTYEVSPPSWDSARCDFKSLNADGSAVATGGHTIIGEPLHDSMMATVSASDGLSGASMGTAHVTAVELAGQVLGDAREAIEMLDAKLGGADVMVISCARLIRIDFTAAGSLLNWVTARTGEGRQVQFSDVNRLIAAFFNVIGISEHARVVPRRE